MDPASGLLELSPDPIVVADETGTITGANGQAETALGCDADDLVGTNLTDVLRVPTFGDEDALFDDERHGPERRFLSRVVAGYAQRPDGGAVPVDAALAAREVAGERRLVASLRTDVDRQRHARDAPASDERYRRLLESSPAPIVLHDAERTVRYANEAAANLLAENRPEDVVGTPALDYIHPDEREDSRAGIARVIEDGETVVGVERRLLTAEDETRHVVLSCVPATYDGEPAGQVVLSDVTALKDREHALQRQNERLDRFASIVSHDLRNPLAVLQSSLEMAAETNDDSEHVARARRATDRMEQLVDDLLTIARQDETPVETSPVAITDVTRAAWATVGTADAELVVEASGTVDADESRLQELLENLFRNAVVHGGDDVTVTVGETAEGVFVADDGRGVPPEDREAVFENGYSSADGGTGLGLAIVDEIVDAHGWNVTLTESEIGGARFEIDGARLL